MPDHNPKFGHIRRYVLYFLAMAEEVLYGLLAVAFVATALWVLIRAAETVNGASAESIVETTLDSLLVVLMIVELLHTIILFLRTHKFRHQPFLVVGIIAGIRRLLVVTAQETASKHGNGDGYLLDLLVTTLVILGLTWALRMSSTKEMLDE
jgi:uncharacterized membrane protein (DUF373 family)